MFGSCQWWSVVNTRSYETNGRCYGTRASCTTAKGALSRACCVRACVRVSHALKSAHLRSVRIGTIGSIVHGTHCVRLLGDGWTLVLSRHISASPRRRRYVKLCILKERKVHRCYDDDDVAALAILTGKSLSFPDEFSASYRTTTSFNSHFSTLFFSSLSYLPMPGRSAFFPASSYLLYKHTDNL